ncbi:dTDP-4-dehydrorhamnose reductase [Paenibacillus filicis]|uniref:dTDP-4-dehydrorhamnose reductase n=1 Tax=Paenibacillus filicis TaxID=669464 RepID=A0ABU9DQD1_9BACL
MKVLVTGATGQLGQDVVSLFAESHQVVGLGSKQLDIVDDKACMEQVQQFQPDVIIHCAAYTAVDLAEQEADYAYAVNAVGTRNLVNAANVVGSKFCYISTDYVFDGHGTTPYREYDNTNPSGVYGKSKRAGELLVQSLSRKFFIVRTSWVYGLHGNNFVKTMLKLATEREHLKVVHDQVGSPTFTEDLSKFLLELVVTDKYGIYHASNTGACSWYEFAKAIFEEAQVTVRLEPCTTEEFPRPAARPPFSVMDHMSIRTNVLQDLRPWREGLKEFLKKYLQNTK